MPGDDKVPVRLLPRFDSVGATAMMLPLTVFSLTALSAHSVSALEAPPKPPRRLQALCFSRMPCRRSIEREIAMTSSEGICRITSSVLESTTFTTVIPVS